MQYLQVIITCNKSFSRGELTAFTFIFLKLVCVCVMTVAGSSVTVTTAGHFTFGGQWEVKALPFRWFPVTLGAVLHVPLTEAKAIYFRLVLNPVWSKLLSEIPIYSFPPISCHCIIIYGWHDMLTFYYQRCFLDGLKPDRSNDSI